MRLRPDLGWQEISLEAHVHGPLGAPEAAGTLRLDGLEAAGAALSRLAVEGSGHAGGVQLTATAEGVRIPGPRPDLLAGAPLRLTASADLRAPARPVRFELSHPLVTVAGTALTAGTLVGGRHPHAAPTWRRSPPRRAPTSPAAAALTLHGTPTEAVIDGTVGITGGMAPLAALMGGAARIGVTVGRDDGTITLARLALTGATMDLSAHGSLAGSRAALDWQLRLADLKAVSPDLAGDLAGQGHVGGRLDDLSVTADLAGSLGTQGFPPSPGARGALRDRAARPSRRLDLRRRSVGRPAADPRRHRQPRRRRRPRGPHRSCRLAEHPCRGALTLPAGSVMPLGNMTATIGNLADFEPLVGKRLAGSVAAALRTDQQGGTPVAALEVTARNAGLPGTASVGEARLAARVRDPLANPTTEATLTVSGLSAGTIGGGLTLAASGPANAIGLRLEPGLPGSAAPTSGWPAGRRWTAAPARWRSPPSRQAGKARRSGCSRRRSSPSRTASPSTGCGSGSAAPSSRWPAA